MDEVMRDLEKMFAELKHIYAVIQMCSDEKEKFIADAKRTNNKDEREDFMHLAMIRTRRINDHKATLSNKTEELECLLLSLQAWAEKEA